MMLKLEYRSHWHAHIQQEGDRRDIPRNGLLLCTVFVCSMLVQMAIVRLGPWMEGLCVIVSAPVEMVLYYVTCVP